MAWQKPQPTLNAKVGNDDLKGGVFVQDGVIMVDLRVEADNGQGGTTTETRAVPLADVASLGITQVQFVNAWKAIRDHILPLMGFNDVP